jgi:hypothetical protein
MQIAHYGKNFLSRLNVEDLYSLSYGNSTGSDQFQKCTNNMLPWLPGGDECEIDLFKKSALWRIVYSHLAYLIGQIIVFIRKLY